MQVIISLSGIGKLERLRSKEEQKNIEERAYIRSGALMPMSSRARRNTT